MLPSEPPFLSISLLSPLSCARYKIHQSTHPSFPLPEPSQARPTPLANHIAPNPVRVRGTLRDERASSWGTLLQKIRGCVCTGVSDMDVNI